MLEALEEQLLDPSVIAEAIQRALDATKQPEQTVATQRKRIEKTLAKLDAELARLGNAVAAAGVDMPTLLDAIRDRERQRSEAKEALTALLRPTPVGFDRKAGEAKIMARLKDWRGLLRDHAPKARQILRKLIDGRITFHPDPDRRVYRFETTGTLGRFFEGLVSVQERWRPHRD